MKKRHAERSTPDEVWLKYYCALKQILRGQIPLLPHLLVSGGTRPLQLAFLSCTHAWCFLRVVWKVAIYALGLY